MPPEPDDARDRPSNGRAPVLRRFHDDDVRVRAASVGSGATDRPNERNGSFLRNYHGKEDGRGRAKGESTCLLLFLLHASQLLPRHIAGCAGFWRCREKCDSRINCPVAIQCEDMDMG